jgi:hypothetical protein
MAIDGTRIQRITKEGLFYLDENNEEVFIDFQACYEFHHQKAIQNLNAKKSQEQDLKIIEMIEMIERAFRLQKQKDVADGSLFGFTVRGVPTLRFHTDPPTLFEFETEKEFDGVKTSVEEYQWDVCVFTTSGDIKQVTPHGLIYTYGNEEIFITFAECYERKLAQYLSQIQAQNTSLVYKRFEQAREMIQGVLYVGERRFVEGGDGLIFNYLDFYTAPRVRFMEDWQSAKQIIDEIEQHGWKVYIWS